MEYHSKYTGAEVDALLDKIAEDNVGDIDSALSTTSENPVMNKVVTAELNKKATKDEVTTLEAGVNANKDLLETQGEKIQFLDQSKANTTGYYPQLHVGLSDNLPDRGDVTEGLIGFRESAGAGNSIEDGTANVVELLGNSVVWNNQSENSLSQNSPTQSLPIGSKLVQGHKYLMSAESITNCFLYLYYNIDGSNVRKMFDKTYSFFTSDASISANGLISGQGALWWYVLVQDSTLEYSANNVRLIDLTQMFGAGKEPSTIEEFNARKNQLVGVDFNAYNAGEVLGVNIKGIKSVNDNAWDEEWRKGSYDNQGNYISTDPFVASKNPVKVLPNKEYHFSHKQGEAVFVVCWYDNNMKFISRVYLSNNATTISPNGACYMNFRMQEAYGLTYNHDICIRLAHSGYKTDYVAHEVSESSFDLTKYFPNGMHGLNGVRDSVTPKKATRRFGVAKMKDLSWNRGFSGFYSDDIVSANDGTRISIISNKYTSVVYNPFESGDKLIRAIYGGEGYTYNGKPNIIDSSYTDVESFVASLTDEDILIYELATPIETEIDPQLNMNYKVWDFGTEELLTDSKSAPVLARTIYGFNATDTIRGNKAKNEEQDERMRILEGEVVRIGDYSPTNKVGTADDLAGRGESVPASFGFRASGGKSIKDGRAYIKRIKGNSVVWNQLAHSLDENHWRNNNANYHDLSFDNGVAIATAKDVEMPKSHNWSMASRGEINAFYANHKYLIVFDYYESVALKNKLLLYMAGESISLTYAHTNDWQTLSIFYKPSNNSTATYLLFYPEVVPNTNYDGEVWKLRNFRIIDLTKMFGAGNEPTTIEDFNARVATLGVDMYAYNEGQVIHCNTKSIKSVGDNAWDEEWESGSYDLTTGEPVAYSAYIRTKNFIDALPNETYYIKPANVGRILYYDQDHSFIGVSDSFGGGSRNITTPANCRYMRYRWEGSTYNHDIMITLVHSGWKQDTDAGYQPYWQDTLPLPIINKYFPDGMKSAGSAHDEIRYNKASGKWEYSKGKIKSVDMGTLEWRYQGVTDSYPYGFLYTNLSKDLLDKAKGGIVLCKLYPNGGFRDDKTIGTNSANTIVYVKDSSYTDAASFKAAMAGVMLYYESNDWEWVELDEADQNFRDYYNVADFGTEEAILATDAEGNIIPSAAFSADIIYQFNAVDMIREHEIEINELQSIIATMQAQLASLTSNNA